MKKVLLYLCMISPAFANESFSLFLSQEEQVLLDTEKDKELTTSKITLSAIMYSGPDNWAFWLNDLKITPEAIPDHIHVLQVDPHMVQMTYTSDAGKLTQTLKVQEPLHLMSKP